MIESIEDMIEVHSAGVETMQKRIEKLEAENAALKHTLRSIAANTCCKPCQEAKLVAQAALQEVSDG